MTDFIVIRRLRLQRLEKIFAARKVNGSRRYGRREMTASKMSAMAITWE